VITFTNQTGDTAFDYLQDVIPNLLITNLENTGFLYVATWERMFDLLKQMGRENVTKIDSELGFVLCRREGIEAIVIGTYTKAGDVFVTDAKVLDVETQRLMKSASSRGEVVDSILKAQGYLGLGFYHAVMGRFDYAIQNLDRAEELWRKDKNFYGISISNLMKGLINIDKGEFGSARTYLKEYLDFNSDYQPQFIKRIQADFHILLGFLDVKEGKLESGKKHEEEAQKLLPGSKQEDPKWAVAQEFRFHLLRAEISLAEGAIEKAIEAMENAPPLDILAMSPTAVMSLNMPILQDVLARLI
jgi:tetratricopeptide (TPR) repeat protein